ncbi:MAG: hypothetical protein HY721_08540 [Planctomycetes bacterium]|nr:hypothetical protein [Planctomycetota bacterium]
MTPNDTGVAASYAAPLVQAEQALLAANKFILLHYPIGVTGAVPHLLSLPSGEVWIVPVVSTSPGYGVVGEVGIVAVDSRTGAVAGSTPRRELAEALKRLREEKHDAIEAAFLRARKA